jgi:hypothetical protein
MLGNNVTDKNHSYQFTVGIGALRTTAIGELHKDLAAAKVQQLASYCFTAPMITNEESSNSYTLTQFSSSLAVRLARIWNLLFGDHEWYNEARAVALLHEGSARSVQLTDEQRHSLIALFDQLNGCAPQLIEGLERSNFDKREWQLVDLYNFVDAQLAQRPKVKLLLGKAANMASTLALKAIDSYVKTLVGVDIPRSGKRISGTACAAQLLMHIAAELAKPQTSISHVKNRGTRRAQSADSERRGRSSVRREVEQKRHQPPRSQSVGLPIARR